MKSTAIHMGIVEYEESSSLKSPMYMLAGEPSKLDPNAILSSSGDHTPYNF